MPRRNNFFRFLAGRTVARARYTPKAYQRHQKKGQTQGCWDPSGTFEGRSIVVAGSGPLTMAVVEKIVCEGARVILLWDSDQGMSVEEVKAVLASPLITTYPVSSSSQSSVANAVYSLTSTQLPIDSILLCCEGSGPKAFARATVFPYLVTFILLPYLQSYATNESPCRIVFLVPPSAIETRLNTKRLLTPHRPLSEGYSAGLAARATALLMNEWHLRTQGRNILVAGTIAATDSGAKADARRSPSQTVDTAVWLLLEDTSKVNAGCFYLDHAECRINWPGMRTKTHRKKTIEVWDACLRIARSQKLPSEPTPRQVAIPIQDNGV